MCRGLEGRKYVIYWVQKVRGKGNGRAGRKDGVGTLQNSKFPDSSQGPALQAGFRKDSSLRPDVGTFLVHTTWGCSGQLVSRARMLPSIQSELTGLLPQLTIFPTPNDSVRVVVTHNLLFPKLSIYLFAVYP